MNERTGYNDLSIKIFERFSTTPVPDPAGDLENARIESCETIFPGGLYGAGRLFVPRPVVGAFLFKGGNRVVFRNKGQVVYEGELGKIGYRVEDGANQGITVDCSGYWGALLGVRTWDKRWVDIRLSEDAWRWDTSATANGQDKISLDRNTRIRFTPQNEQLVTNPEIAAVSYTMPTGETIKRVALSREMKEKFLVTASKVKHAQYDGYGVSTKVFGFASPSTYNDLTNAYDADTGTSSSFTLATTGFLYVRYNKAFSKLSINVGATVNTNAATMTVQYYDGENWQTASGLSDGTSTGGKMFAQDGIVSWTTPGAQDEVTVNSSRGFWVRISCSANLTAVDFVEIDVEDTTIYTYTDKDNTIDGSSSTTNTITLITTDYLYVKTANGDNFGLVRFEFGGTVNSVASVLSAQYPSVDDQGIVTWNSLTIVDGTDTGGVTFGDDGDVTFTQPANIAEVSIDGVRGLWLRFAISVNLTANVVIEEILTGKTQNWTLRLRDRNSPATTIWEQTSSGSGTQDNALATPRQALHLEYHSVTQQIGEGNGTVYGQVSGVEVYSETGSITLYEIARDVRAKVTDLNSDESNIDSVFFNPLIPFMTNGPETMTSILTRAASYGDAAYDQWNPHIRESDTAASPDGKPVLFLKEYLPLTDHDYVIRIDEENLIPPLEILIDYDGIINWVSIRYTDATTGYEVILTPDDDATLKDTTSITNWGERHIQQPLDGGTANSDNAGLYARRVLDANKDPKFYVSGPITVVGYIRAKNGSSVPASQIQAGKRIKIENFLEDKAYVSGAGLTFMITQTSYDDTAETCSISTGIPDSLATFLAQRALMDERKNL